MIYFIVNWHGDAVKIGYSADPAKRFSAIQSHNSHSLRLVAVIDGEREDEAALHERWGDHRILGEWFAYRGGLREFVESQPPYEKPCRKTARFWGGKTAADVARETGISKAALSEIQSGKFRPSVGQALKLQRATGVSALWLVFRDDAEEAADGFVLSRVPAHA